MTETIEIIDGKLKITKTGDTVITTMTREEVVGKRAEVQTGVDHLSANLAKTQAEVVKWDNYLNAIDVEL